MLLLVTEETGPVELANDTRSTWRSIARDHYWQTDTKDGITLEICKRESGKYDWWLYADDSPEPDAPVTGEDSLTLQNALDEAYDAVHSWKNGNKEETRGAYREND